ncbi:hypothetical protein ACJMK2_023743 [Sinanodonta woodiana]|uniref:Uncharacterized protein n=1 Tax=Sinanodonta woodiana TaxID=1069815 RepID=A0ABD3T571_SINWO
MQGESLCPHRRQYGWSCLKYDTSQPFPQSRSKHAICLHGDYLYMYAGRDGNISLKDFWRLHIGDMRWEKLNYRGDQPPHLEGHTLVSSQSVLLLFGGEFGDGLTESSLWIINPDLEYIRKVCLDPGCERPCVRRYHSAVMYNGCMYVYGGFVDIRGSSSELWAYHMDAEEWEQISVRHSGQDGSPGGLHGHSAIIHREQMWIYGGMSDLNIKSDLWRFTFASKCWEKMKLKYGPPVLTGHSATVLGDQMLIFGGESNREMVNTLWTLCLKTLIWRQSHCNENLPLPRNFHCSVGVMASSDSDRYLKVGSLPYLQKKMKQLKIERPKTSPESGKVKETGTQLSFHPDHFYTGDCHRDSLNQVKRTIDVASNTKTLSTPQVLSLEKIERENSRVLTANSKEVKDKSPLLEAGKGHFKHTPNRQYSSSSGDGIDNAGVSSSMEELIYISCRPRSVSTDLDDRLDTSRPLRRRRHAKEFQADRYLSQRQSSLQEVTNGLSRETTPAFSHSVFNNSYSSLNSDYHPQRGKRSKLDHDLVLEDLELYDCFPQKIELPFPGSRCSTFPNFLGNSNTVHNEDEIEDKIHITELNDLKNGDIDLHEAESREVTMQEIWLESPLKEEKRPHSWEVLSPESQKDMETKRFNVHGTMEQETQFYNIPTTSESRNGKGLTSCIQTKSVKDRTMQRSVNDPPYMLIIGGKDKQGNNLQSKPLPIWIYRTSGSI